MTVAADGLTSITETWRALRTPGLVEDLRQADVDFATGNTISGQELRERYGL